MMTLPFYKICLDITLLMILLPFIEVVHTPLEHQLDVIEESKPCYSCIYAMDPNWGGRLLYTIMLIHEDEFIIHR